MFPRIKANPPVPSFFLVVKAQDRVCPVSSQLPRMQKDLQHPCLPCPGQEQQLTLLSEVQPTYCQVFSAQGLAQEEPWTHWDPQEPSDLPLAMSSEH